MHYLIFYPIWILIHNLFIFLFFYQSLCLMVFLWCGMIFLFLRSTCIIKQPQKRFPFYIWKVSYFISIFHLPTFYVALLNLSKNIVTYYFHLVEFLVHIFCVFVSLLKHAFSYTWKQMYSFHDDRHCCHQISTSSSLTS